MTNVKDAIRQLSDDGGDPPEADRDAVERVAGEDAVDLAMKQGDVYLVDGVLKVTDPDRIRTDGGDDVPLRSVTIRSWEDIDSAPMLTGAEKEALVRLLEDTDFDSGFLLPEFKLEEDDHDVVRANDDGHVDVGVDCGRLAVGYWEEYSDASIRTTQFHRKNDPSIDTPNPGCYIPKSTTVVWEASDRLESIETPQGRLSDFL